MILDELISFYEYERERLITILKYEVSQKNVLRTAERLLAEDYRERKSKIRSDILKRRVSKSQPRFEDWIQIKHLREECNDKRKENEISDDFN